MGIRWQMLWPMNRIHGKLLIFFLIVALIPVLSLGVLSFIKSSSLINSQLGAYGSYAVNQLKQQLDANLSRMEYLANDVIAYLSNSVIQIPDSEPATYLAYVESNNLQRFLRNYSPNEWALVITQSGKVYGSKTIAYTELNEQGWWKSSFPTSIGRAWVGFHSAQYYGGNRQNGSLISLIATVGENFNVPDGSVILVEMDADPILQLFHSFEQDTDTYLKLTDPTGSIIYETPGGFEPQADDRIWAETLDTTGWSIEARMHSAQFFESANVIRGYMLAIAVASLVIALLCAELFSSSITRRIRKLSNTMHMAGLGKLSVRAADGAKDELGILSRNFDRMIDKIRRLIDDIGMAERQKKETEIRLLHYQINPHVLFNTLNTIQWKARLAGQREIEKMLMHFVAVLEESLNFKQEIVPLHREVEMLHHFLAIQRFRFGDVFEYTESIDWEVSDCGIPRMTLQPLLENIFFHAFVDGKGAIHLNVARSEDSHVKVELLDNGKGMTSEQREMLLKSKPAGLRGGHGLYNTDRKIKLHFGADFGVAVQSEPGSGTKMIVTLPYQRRTS